MAISLCPVLMNFSMQITHLNQKWSTALFVFRQLRHQENQLPASAFLVINHIPLLVHLCVCVWSTGWKWTAVQTKQQKKQSQIYGIQNDVNSTTLCFVANSQGRESNFLHM